MPFYVVKYDNYGVDCGLSWDSGYYKYVHTLYNSDTGEIGTLTAFSHGGGTVNSLSDVKVSDEEINAYFKVPAEIKEIYAIAQKKLDDEIAEKKRIAREAAEAAAAIEFANMIAEDTRALILTEEAALRKMYSKHGEKVYSECVKICKSYLKGKLKSSFRKSLAEQIMDWCHDAEKQQKYDFPLSRKQTEALSNGMQERYGYGRRYR